MPAKTLIAIQTSDHVTMRCENIGARRRAAASSVPRSGAGDSAGEMIRNVAAISPEIAAEAPTT